MRLSLGMTWTFVLKVHALVLPPHIDSAISLPDSSYSVFYESQDYPLVKYLRTPLYFEVELMYSQDPQVDLVLENCWATYSADRNSLPQWDVIVER